MVAIIVAANLPKIAYQDVIVHCNDYDRINRSGQHQDLMAMAGVLDAHCAPGEPVALQDGYITSIHYVTDRHVVRLPLASDRDDQPVTEKDADQTLAFLRDHPELHCVILDLTSRNKRNKAFWERLISGLQDELGAKEIYISQKKSLQVFRLHG